MSDSSKKQVTANRQNAQKSKGPNNVTTTRYNAIKHGLLGEGVTELDDKKHFVALSRKLEDEFMPSSTVEYFLVGRIASVFCGSNERAYWRLNTLLPN